MVYHKGQSWDLYSSASMLMIYLCIYHQILQNVICSRMTQNFKQLEKAFCKFKKTLQLCLDRISEWCNVNNMLINPVKTKSMIITTRQKHQLSDLTLTLSLDGQNIENVTEHPCLNAHIKPHIDYPSVVWDGCGQVHLKELNSLHRRAGKLILPDPSLSTEQMMNALGILNLQQKLAYNKGIFMHKVLKKNSPNCLAQLFISYQFYYTNSRNILYVPRPRLDLFQTSLSFAGASLWNSLPQNIN